jgi:hypothetical protein
MKWLKLMLCVMALAALTTVPVGCKKQGITELKPAETIPSGHASEVVERSKSATDEAKSASKGVNAEAPKK